MSDHYWSSHIHPQRYVHACMLVLFLFAAACKQQPGQSTTRPFLADSIMGATDKLLNSGQLSAALHYVDSSYQVFTDAGPYDLWLKYNFKANFYLNYQFDTLKARVYTDSMLVMVEGKKDLYKAEYANTLFAYGNLLVAERRYEEAFYYFYNGQVYARRHLDSCRLAPFNSHLGMVRYKQGKYLTAIPYLRDALDELDHCPENGTFFERFIQPQSILNTIALCYQKAENLDSAIFYYRQALSFINEHDHLYKEDTAYASTARGVVMGNLGGLYARQNKYNEAVRYLGESIRINNRPGYAISDAQTAVAKLADLHLRFKQLPAASQLLDEQERYLVAFAAKNPDYDDIRLKWYRLKWMYYDSAHVIPQAYNYSTLYHNLKDSIALASQGLSNVDMDESFRDAAEQLKLELLNKEDELKTISLLALIVGLLMAISILFILWRHLSRTRDTNKEIQSQNEHLQLALNALEQSQADNTRMMKVVAHDLRSPVGAITSIAAMLLEFSKLSEEDKMMVELIQTSGQNSLDMVSDLLQVNTHAEQLKKEPVDLQQLLHYCVDLLQHKATVKKQHIHLHAMPGLIMVSREKMWRVISNLIANAIKFSPIGTEINIRLEMQLHQTLIAVEDRGIGIPDNLKDKIFDMFSEAKRRGTAGEQPFGLGLAISKQIVEAHGGSIGFESREGGGTTFFVRLPV
ncbi:tetratricopeptide repeat protein [Chitinophaga sp. SYP-B3965]|uniref:tetratricopeptide repeat-containing sensor histidine kinase n=1 Tax=Chitinophaga sp. SYP-B3965 TaxID=2663120 RepID=UPI001299A386|nr:tetratricopeptide repeat-containing sensor histidine kinase [Chitinophaga sp. SYP-B3965]MRG44013.1 tetratricopeptide repeat protein [Chitinophaga sp. SYP-B3965]